MRRYREIEAAYAALVKRTLSLSSSASSSVCMIPMNTELLLLGARPCLDPTFFTWIGLATISLWIKLDLLSVEEVSVLLRWVSALIFITTIHSSQAFSAGPPAFTVYVPVRHDPQTSFLHFWSQLKLHLLRFLTYWLIESYLLLSIICQITNLAFR